MDDHQAIEIVQPNDAAVRTDTARSDASMTVEELTDRVTRWISRLQEERPTGFLAAGTSRHSIFRSPMPLYRDNPIPMPVEPNPILGEPIPLYPIPMPVEPNPILGEPTPLYGDNPIPMPVEPNPILGEPIPLYRDNPIPMPVEPNSMPVEPNPIPGEPMPRYRDGPIRMPVEPEIASVGPYRRGARQVHPRAPLHRNDPILVAVEPEIVSIGPYNRGPHQVQVLEFEQLKPLFLQSFLRRTRSSFERLTRAVEEEESSARSRYSGHVDVTRADFLRMMLLDGCFVLELLLGFFECGDATDVDSPIFTRPQIIPILIRDLLKLENQIPYSLLLSLFDASASYKLIGAEDSLATLALKLFDQAYPRSMARPRSSRNLECEHLLDLFYSSLYPTSRVHPNRTKEYWPPSSLSVPCVTELRPSGIKFKSRRKADSLLDISFRKRVLQIPCIAMDDFMTTVLINCVYLEQCWGNGSKYMTDYVYFMHCLIKQPKDVSLLRSDGIIAPFSRDDHYVADLFDKLGKSISFDLHDCFLSQQFQELESYYRSDWANMMRTYFSSPWSSISAFSAFLALVLSITQTVFAILAYRSQR
ncbi:UPF0481 protein At3g47200-like [Syzygium oleosum]|uniref:UPF0481 protein At3g47200-like n=1 Tax=Syzygium oleosum TaxID=219896 RepID=UPI0011D24854|nr:UPF0481 protein At3g47200-like [Syzygium oleosum]